MIPDLRNDAVLLALLSMVIDGVDPVPPGAIQAAAAACELRHVDCELASLVADSTVGGRVLLRDEADRTVLTFRSRQMSVEVEIDRDGYAVGLISPPAAADIAVENIVPCSSLARVSTRSDDLGRFQIGVGTGLCRLRIGSGDRAVFTSWFYS
jgi:hypothetical protein